MRMELQCTAHTPPHLGHIHISVSIPSHPPLTPFAFLHGYKYKRLHLSHPFFFHHAQEPYFSIDNNGRDLIVHYVFHSIVYTPRYCPLYVRGQPYTLWK